MKEDLNKWFKEKWVNIGKKVDGKHPPCGTSGEKKGYAKCVPAAKAAGMSKKEKESATRRKRDAQNDAGRGGKDSSGQGKKPIYVSTKPKNETMSIEERLNLFLEKNCPTDPAKWSASKSAAKSKFDVYPSAYANGWAAKNYKGKGGGWRSCSESVNEVSQLYKDWDEHVNPDYILVTLKNGKKLKIEKKRMQGGQRVYQAILQAFNDDKHQITDKLIAGMIQRLGENAMCDECWDGYKQVGMKDKDGKQVPNCVPVKENINDMETKNAEQHKRVTNHPNRRDTDSELNNGRVEPIEYDVDNADDIRDFIIYMREYTKQLQEAGCNCVYEAEYQGRKVKLGKPMQGDVKKFKVYVKNDKGNVVKVNFGDPNMRIKKSNPERRKSFRARHNCDTPGPRWKARYWSCRKW